MDAYLINPARILITPAQVPDEWPPARERAAQVLLDLYSQHLVARRDWVMRRAQETIVERQPYAHGRVHQRPFAALDELGLSEAAREAVVDVVAVFVDETIEHTLALLGAATNTVGDYDSVEYELTARVVHHDLSLARRMSTENLIGAWRSDMAEVMAMGATGGAEDAVDGAGVLTSHGEIAGEATPPEESEESRMPIGRGEALWFDYRKWLRQFATQRRSARPSRLW
ncbi:MAG TPA: hypothetical protein VF818_09760 [Ktedonobacterales bacterium]